MRILKCLALTTLAIVGLVVPALVMAQDTTIQGQGDDFRWGFGARKGIIIQDQPITMPAVNATITVSAEAASTADTREIVVTLLDADGNAINYISNVELWLCLNATCTDFVATGGSTGIAEDASPAGGNILAVVAKKIFAARTTTAGLLNLTWLDTGTEAAFLGVKLPSGRLIISSALTNA